MNWIVLNLRQTDRHWLLTEQTCKWSVSYIMLVSALKSSLPLPTVIWTQRSSVWWRLSGVSGNHSSWMNLPGNRLPFVHTEPSRVSRGSVDYDRVSGVVYWSQSSTDTSHSWSLGAHPIVDALSWKSTSQMQFLSSWKVGGLAVDWFTGNVYVSETEDHLIAVARYDIKDADMYRVIISSGLRAPTTVALDPYLGYCNFTVRNVHHFCFRYFRFFLQFIICG